jgi:hypothetical protein
VSRVELRCFSPSHQLSIAPPRHRDRVPKRSRRGEFSRVGSHPQRRPRIWRSDSQWFPVLSLDLL